MLLGFNCTQVPTQSAFWKVCAPSTHCEGAVDSPDLLEASSCFKLFFFFLCCSKKNNNICFMWVAKRVGDVSEGSFNCLFPKEDRKASHHVCVRASCLWLWPSANCHSPWDFSAPICVLHSLLLTWLESIGTVSVHGKSLLTSAGLRYLCNNNCLSCILLDSMG